MTYPDAIGKGLLACLFIFMKQGAVAQLAGAAPVIHDSSYSALITQLRVRTVSEFTQNGESAELSGLLAYDIPGRLKEYTTRLIRTVLLFDALGRYTGELNYDNDTSGVSRFTLYEYDEHMHVIKTKREKMTDMGLDTSITASKVTRKSKNVCARRINYLSAENKPVGFHIEIDSTDGMYENHITISRMEEAWSTEEEKKCSDKTLSRKYTINDYRYEDIVISKLCGNKEVFTRCVTSYERLDKQGRRVEAGILDYAGVLEKYGIKNPRRNQPKTLPAAFVKSVLNGGHRSMEHADPDQLERISYDEQGHILERKNRIQETKNTYNSKHQLVQVLMTGEYNQKIIFTYNADGLLISSHYSLAIPGAETIETHYNYSYSFFE